MGSPMLVEQKWGFQLAVETGWGPTLPVVWGLHCMASWLLLKLEEAISYQQYGALCHCGDGGSTFR